MILLVFSPKFERLLTLADCGDHVIVTNARYLLLTGRKMTDKVYYKHSGSPGHLKVTPVFRMIEKKVASFVSEAYGRVLGKSCVRQSRECFPKISYEDPDWPG